MGKANIWRQELAVQIGNHYSKHPKVDAVALTGSVARELADQYSDIEIHVFWKEAPTDEDRKNIITQAGGEIFQFWPFEEDEWSESFIIQGVKVDLSGFLSEGIDQIIIDVVEQFELTDYKQILLSSIQYAKPLHHPEKLVAWHGRLDAYPDELAKKMIKKHLSFGPRWGPEMLVTRDDLVFLYDLINNAQKNILGVLLGLNRMYLAHPGFKWMEQTIAAMKIKPSNLMTRMKRVYQSSPKEAVEELHSLIEDLFDLIEAHLPEFETESAKAWFQHRRALLESA